MVEMWQPRDLIETYIYLLSHSIEIYLFGALLILFVLYFLKSRNGKRSPGPMGLPMFGYYLFLGKNPMMKLNEVAKKYGNIFSLYLGPKYVVVLNDWDAMKEALSKTSTLDRPDSTFAEIPYKFGVGGTNGPEWVQTRRLTSRAIKDIGLNRVGWEDQLHDEALDLVHRIAQKGGIPIDVRSFLEESFVNNVLSLILGERLGTGDPLKKEITKAVNAIMEFNPTLGLNNFSPKLSQLLQVLGVEKKFLLAEKILQFVKYVSDTVEDKLRDSLSTHEADSFISRFQEEIETHKKDKNSYITVDSLKGNTLALLTGGGETTRTTIIWTLIAMADHPDKQIKVQEELDAVIGKEGTLKWVDHAKVPYTYATLLESMRWGTVVPLVMRKANEDLQIQGYHVSKGTPIVLNTWSIHNDPRYWKNPEQFIPERFLLEYGKKVNASPESFNPFSYGKRSCPGKLLALMSSMLYFVTFMQKFKVMPKDGKKVEYDTLLGLSYQALNVELCFIPR